MATGKIKRLGVQSEFTPEMIQELIKCKKDPLYFIENYVKVKHPTKGVMNMELYEYQKRMLKGIHENKDSLLLCSRQSGKCFYKDTNLVIIQKPSSFFKKAILKFLNKELFDDLFGNGIKETKRNQILPSV